jgi:hypothetical protein
MNKIKPVLMFHEIREWMFDLPLENYTLTFDDGLYSQFYYFERFKNIPTEKIYFISSNIVCEEMQSTEFPCCQTAHKKAFIGNKEDYMTLDQIKELMADPLVTIGGHSHSHTRFGHFDKLMERIVYIKNDTETMLKWFEDNLGFKPTAFCFPYNEDLDGIYREFLKKYGFINFYGRERIAVETLSATVD